MCCKLKIPGSASWNPDQIETAVDYTHKLYIVTNVPYAGFIFTPGEGLYIIHWDETKEKLEQNGLILEAGFDFENYIQTWDEHSTDRMWLVNYLTSPPAINEYIKPVN